MNVDDEDKRDKFFGQVNDAKKKLIMEIENLQIDDKTNKPSSHFNKTPKELEELSNGQSERFREKIRMERRAKTTEARARKIAAANAKKACKEINAHLNGSKTLEKKAVDQKNECSMSDNPGQQRVKPFKFMKDPGFPRNKEGSSKQPMFCETIAPNIHPSFLEFASRCEAKHITGVDAVCVAFVQSIKQFLSDYIISPNQVMSRDLEQAIRQQLNCLTKNGKHSFPLVLGNLVKQLKKEISRLPDSISEQEGKKHLYGWLDDFVQQNFELALQAISSFCLKKMKNMVFMLTYSWCPVVERIILDAHDDKLLFHVHVLDSPIERKGRQLVKTLCERKIKCSYGMLSSVGYLMKECHMVLLGCSAILSNGFVVAERGTSQVALVASALNIPVLIAAQTCKFVDRVQSFSHGIHEVNALMGEKKEVVAADLITALITELRILPPSSAPAVLKAKQLAVDS
ncbi:Translation initiation factor eIF-2B subunit delta [Dirofilaria immitis]